MPRSDRLVTAGELIAWLQQFPPDAVAYGYRVEDAPVVAVSHPAGAGYRYWSFFELTAVEPSKTGTSAAPPPTGGAPAVR